MIISFFSKIRENSEVKIQRIVSSSTVYGQVASLPVLQTLYSAKFTINVMPIYKMGCVCHLVDVQRLSGDGMA